MQTTSPQHQIQQWQVRNWQRWWAWWQRSAVAGAAHVGLILVGLEEVAGQGFELGLKEEDEAKD